MSQSTKNAKTIPTVDNPEFWDNLYRSGRTPWDIGQAAPPLVSLMKSPYAPTPGKVLVLGCGNGHDCMLFAEYGFEVTGIDFAPSAIQATHQKFVEAGIDGTRGFLLERDLFDIHEYDGYYDYIVEHCCFSGLHPSRRRTYAFAVHDLLKPGGKLIGLWWLLPESTVGPPFGLARSDLHEYFGQSFNFDVIYQPHDSIAGRTNAELLTVMTRL